jgi:hypothetical protein
MRQFEALAIDNLLHVEELAREINSLFSPNESLTVNPC